MDKQFRLIAQARALGGKKGEVTVYSVIYPYSYGDGDPTVTSNDFLKRLEALGDVDEITVRINSPGGVVTEAIAIRTALIKHPAKKTVDIEGCCDSAATLIACMPGARVRMAQGGEYMIHRCSGLAWGNADKLFSAYQSAMQTDLGMAAIYAERTGKSAEDCMALMKAETWFGAQEAVDAGFVDEIIQGDKENEGLVACAVTPDALELMRACYEHTPPRGVIPRHPQGEEAPDLSVRNELSAVAAASSTENTQKGVNLMDDLKNATAEQLQQENPALLAAIARQAVEAERERTQAIDDLTPPGARYAEMAKQAKQEGASAQDFFRQVVQEQKKAGEEYLSARAQETRKTAQIGAGDSGDHDHKSDDAENQWARDVAALARGMTAETHELT